ncbi:AI-2E family transporter [Dactylosporangium sp. AC04546]|uniref:AI-2E family transporter n=1 Tax=Dactylosporangium sp. AC04546 TaxID=2862460 RepID=UPI001EDE81AD|nr:AI-2E family transporter [Dactylosporangium sp. AC04546]WVK84505.1 AI-2E family transporter [Dactylosporangium sp. AC04546]
MGRFDQVRANLRRAYQQRVEIARAQRAAAALAEAPPEPEIEELEQLEAELAPGHPSTTSRDDAEVPHGLRIAAAWSWRLLVLVAAAAVLLWLVGRLKTVLIPLSISLLLSALLAPMMGVLRRRVKLPPSLAAFLVLITGLAAVAGVLTLVISEFVDGFPALSDKASDGVQQIQTWLTTGPLHLSGRQLDATFDAASNWLSENRGSLTDSAVSTATATIEFLALLFLVLFVTFFFMRDGKRIWHFLTSILPGQAREPVRRAGEAAWQTLVAYVRATVLVAFIDALGIGLLLVILNVDFWFPLGTLVFLAAFVPIVGATLSGAVAVLVALVDEGPITALVVLIGVIAVQQLEGHVLQPLIMGRAVSVHPLAVIVAISAGVVLAGIIGALVAVPLVAVLNTGIRHLVQHRREPPPDAVIVSSD